MFVYVCAVNAVGGPCGTTKKRWEKHNKQPKTTHLQPKKTATKKKVEKRNNHTNKRSGEMCTHTNTHTHIERKNVEYIQIYL